MLRHVASLRRITTLWSASQREAGLGCFAPLQPRRIRKECYRLCKMLPACSVRAPAASNRLPSEADSLTWTKHVIGDAGNLTYLRNDQPVNGSSFPPNLTVVIEDGDAQSVLSQDSNPFDLYNLSSQYSAPELDEQARSQVSSSGRTSAIRSVPAYVKANPFTSGLTAAGVTVFAAASLVNPVLGIAGFSAIGPIAGSAAAAWQSGIGLVHAGSVFAWCQSVAMGGTAAAGAIAGAQGVGAGIAGLGILTKLRGGDKEVEATDQDATNEDSKNVAKCECEE